MPQSKKTLKTKKVKQPVKVVKSKTRQPLVPQPTKIALKRAYQLVTKDLFARLIKAKDQEKITVGAVGALGSLTKKERKVKSGIRPMQKGKKVSKSKKLNTYVYYHLLFRPSRKLKAELNKPLVKKYS